MTDNGKHFLRTSSPEFSDEAIRRFLLGQLGAAEQKTFEERLFVDDKLEARVRLAEFDLADDYVAERLSRTDRELFKQRFAVTKARHQKLTVSEALRDRFASSAAALSDEKLTLGGHLRLVFDFSQPAWRFAFGAMILVILLATVWLVIKEPRINQRIFARRPPAPAPAPSTVAPEAHHPSSGSALPEHKETPSPLPGHEPNPTANESQSVVKSIVLLPGNSGANMPAFILPERDDGVVRLQLRFEETRPSTYRAEVFNAAGQSIFAAQSLRATYREGAMIDLEVSARLLTAGDYQIKLIQVSDGLEEVVASYYFKVR